MIYQGKFTSRDNIEYTLLIDNHLVDGSSQTKQISLGKPPFTVEVEGGDSIFKPVKMASATITMVSDDYIFNLYSPKPHDVLVTLKRGNAVEWCGYVAPSIYSQDYGDINKTIEIDCTDEISSLQYIRWGAWDSGFTTNPQIMTFYDIVKTLCNKFTSIKRVYFPYVFKDDSTESMITLKTLKVNTRTFIDDEDPKKTFTCLEVLEEMANILNLTIIQNAEELYFIYHGDNDYYIKTTLSTNVDENVYSFMVKTTLDKGYKSSSMSLTECISQVIINTEVKEYNPLIGDLFDDSNFTNYTSGSSGQWGFFIEDEIGDDVKVKTRLLKHVNNPCKAYLGANKNPVNYDSITYYQQIGGYNWAGFIDYLDVVDFSEEQYRYDDHSTNKPDRYLVLNWYYKYWDDDNYQTATTPLFSIKSKEKYFLTSDMMMKLRISGRHQPKHDEGMFIHNVDGNDKPDILVASQNKLVCRLKVGNYYLSNDYPNNRIPIWVTHESNFQVQYNGYSNDSGTVLKKIFNSKFSVIDTSGDHVDRDYESGYLIPPPPIAAFDEPVDIEFSIMSTGVDTLDSPLFFGYWWLTEYIDELSLEFVTGTDNNLKEDEISSDTSYERVIDENYIENEQEITVKISTYDGKGPSYSTLFNGRRYIDLVKNIIETGETPHRFEEWKIYQYVNQYKNPKKQIDLNTDYKPSINSIITIDNDMYFVDAFKIDYYDNKNNSLKLIQL